MIYLGAPHVHVETLGSRKGLLRKFRFNLEARKDSSAFIDAKATQGY